MTLLLWREDFRVGIEEVDFEHRELIELINSTHAQAGAGASADVLDRALGAIHSAISAHFALEEKVMRARHYDALDQHKADHERLLDDIRDIMDDVVLRGVFDESAFGQRLADWFGVHFRTHDARFHRAIER
jgi:hemerythrin